MPASPLAANSSGTPNPGIALSNVVGLEVDALPQHTPASHATPDPKRQMIRAQLLGSHEHVASNGTNILIFMRDGRFVARGSLNSRRFGETLPSDERAAQARLCEIIADVGAGTYLVPSERKRRPLKRTPSSRVSLRQIADAYLADIRTLRGLKTMCDYRARLIPALEYAEQQAVRSRYPFGADIDRDWALGFRAFLFAKKVTPNGHPMAIPRQMSGRQVHNVLCTISMMLNHARDPRTSRLPLTFANPFTRDLLGDRPRRDPLEPPRMPLDKRIALLGQLDRWGVCALALPLVLPQRPEEFDGLLIEDVACDSRQLIFKTRLGGDDFNKAHQSFRCCYPPQFDPIINELIGGRKNGPLLRSRRSVGSHDEDAVSEQIGVISSYQSALAAAVEGEVQAPADRKRIFRQVLRKLGGLQKSDLNGAFKTALSAIGAVNHARFYDLRGSIITDLKRAGVEEILRLYVTGRSLDHKIASHYETQDLADDMAKYFQYIGPLIEAIASRYALLSSN